MITTATDIPRRTILRAAGLAFYRITHDGGFTVNVRHPDESAPASGFAVSLQDREERIDLAAFGPYDVIEYVDSHLDALSTPGVFLGGWVHDGTVFLDCSLIVAELEDALVIGEWHKQLAIYDLANDVEISLTTDVKGS